jgi:aldose 1-epimerase
MKILSRIFFVAVAMSLLIALVGPGVRPAAASGTIVKNPYGVTADGIPVDEYTLTNAHHMEVKIITYGGIITSVKVPDKKGQFTNVVLGFDNLQGYEGMTTYFGCITGRYANRILRGNLHWMVWSTSSTLITPQTTCMAVSKALISRSGR